MVRHLRCWGSEASGKHIPSIGVTRLRNETRALIWADELISNQSATKPGMWRNIHCEAEHSHLEGVPNSDR
jgi:hypothetical protein